MDKIKNIILIRHGDYTADALTDLGKEQISKLAEKLTVFINDKPIIKIFTSPFTRTIMSAEIIAQNFKVETVTKIDFMGEDDLEEEKIYEFIKTQVAEAESIILVTHVQHVRFFPQFFSLVEWERMEEIDDIKTGEAVVIDCLNKKLIQLKRSI